MSRFILLLAFLPLTLGCGSRMTREAKVYKAEVTWFTQAATEQARHLEAFISKHCICVNGRFGDSLCERAAQTALTAKFRAPWHKAMGLFNAGLIETRPPANPPIIPDASSLCPGGS